VKSSRIVSILVFLVAFAFNEWAFRFIFPLQPIDSFLRLMTLVLDGFLLTVVLALWIGNDSISGKLKHLMNNHSKWLGLFFGLFFSYCLLMTIEFSCRYYFKHVYKAPYSEATYWEPSALERDSVLGSALAKDTVISHASVVNDSLVYKQYYRTDPFRRRINPPSYPDSTYNEFAMVTGCSFAFGYGLSENQTLSHYLDSITGKRSYNYGVAGHGTQQTLALLQSRALKQEIGEENGVLVHLFIDDHIARLIGSRRLIKLWAQNFPYYYLDGEELKRNGSFWTGRHWLTRFYRAISQSAFIDLFDIDFPWYVSNGHMRLFGAVLEESKREFLEQYPNGKFVVVIGPNSKLASRLVEELNHRNVDVLDLSNLLNKEEKQYKIHWTEGHPNGNYYRAIAVEIDAYLSRQESTSSNTR
jgi:hypothetical protein